MNHVRFMISPELNVVQEAFSFDIDLKGGSCCKIDHCRFLPSLAIEIEA